MSYALTNKDRMALNELLTHTYAFQISASSERGARNNMQFLLTAPGRTRSWHTGDGFSIVEAVDSWFERVANTDGRLWRDVSSTLYEAKAHESEIIGEEAQFYG